MRSFGVGNKTLNDSMWASNPASLNLERIHSALSLSYAEPTWCGRALMRRIFSRTLSLTMASWNFFSQSCSDLEEAAVYPESWLEVFAGEGWASIQCVNRRTAPQAASERIVFKGSSGT